MSIGPKEEEVVGRGIHNASATKSANPKVKQSEQSIMRLFKYFACGRMQEETARTDDALLDKKICQLRAIKRSYRFVYFLLSNSRLPEAINLNTQLGDTGIGYYGARNSRLISYSAFLTSTIRIEAESRKTERHYR